MLSPNILNRHNLPFPPHYTPGSLVWAERPNPSSVSSSSSSPPRPAFWPAEVADLEVNPAPDGCRLKVRYLGHPNALSILAGEQCLPFAAEFERLSRQGGGKDWTEAVHIATQLEKEVKAKLEGGRGADGQGGGEDGGGHSLAPGFSPSLLRASVSSPGNIGLGTRIRLRSADIIHHKLKEYANTDAEIMEVPSHPNTWFGVRLFDGKEIKIRKSAFDVTAAPGDGAAGGRDSSAASSSGSAGGVSAVPQLPASVFPSLLSSVTSSSSSPVGSVSSTPRSVLSDFSRMSTPFMFAPPFTPLPVSPAHLALYHSSVRPLAKHSHVRIILTPDTRPFPELVGKEAMVLSVEEGGQHLIRLKDGVTTVKLHRMSLQLMDDDPLSSMMQMQMSSGSGGGQAAASGLMPPIFNFGFSTNTTPVSDKRHTAAAATGGHSAAAAGSGAAGSSAGAEGRPGTAESTGSDVSIGTVASTPKEGKKSDDGREGGGSGRTRRIQGGGGREGRADSGEEGSSCSGRADAVHACERRSRGFGQHVIARRGCRHVFF